MTALPLGQFLIIPTSLLVTFWQKQTDLVILAKTLDDITQLALLVTLEVGLTQNSAIVTAYCCTIYQWRLWQWQNLKAFSRSAVGQWVKWANLSGTWCKAQFPNNKNSKNSHLHSDTISNSNGAVLSALEFVFYATIISGDFPKSILIGLLFCRYWSVYQWCWVRY